MTITIPWSYDVFDFDEDGNSHAREEQRHGTRTIPIKILRDCGDVLLIRTKSGTSGRVRKEMVRL